MSSYGSMSPAGDSSPILDHYEAQYYCQGQHEQDNHLITGDGVYWSGHELDHSILEKHQTHAGDMYPGQYMARNYAYNALHADYEAYGEHDGALGALSLHAQAQHGAQGAGFAVHGAHACFGGGAAAAGQAAPFVRVVKSTANKKERRRTQSINTAFSDLRECIPNVPADTKLSKIKTLRLATSYISYLMGVLDGESEQVGGFRAELTSTQGRRAARHQKAQHNAPTATQTQLIEHHPAVDHARHNSPGHDSRRSKGRTGWPQHVWALELKQEQNI